MDRVKVIAVCVLCAPLVVQTSNAAPLPSLQGATPVDRWQDFIAAAATQFGIPDTWIRSVMRVESGGRTTLHGKPITSSAGAMGLMQVMPNTYRGLRQQYGLGYDAYDPKDNIFAGAAFLRQMYERYGYPTLFAAYNAGPKRLDGFLQRGEPLPRETLSYVASIVPGADIALTQDTTTAPIAPVQRTPTAPALDHSVSPDALFFLRASPSTAPKGTAERALLSPEMATSGSDFVSPKSAALFVPLSSDTR
ncbi:MAG TPA: lytic transglycosylase domain-containing protein [Rhizomicrobium sp.]|jgi:hypothetical protein